MIMVASTVAVAGDDFPGSKPDSRFLKTQEKVDSLFEKGDYGRAYFIYLNELAPLGDKYAQYMVGYMNITGKGVERDYIAGSAWYRLAAERGDASYSQARDEILQQFNDEQRRQSDEKYQELRLQYSDAMIVADIVEKDIAKINNSVPNAGALVLTADSHKYTKTQRERVTEILKMNIEERLTFLRSAIASTPEMAAAEIDRIEELEKLAAALPEQ